MASLHAWLSWLSKTLGLAAQPTLCRACTGGEAARFLRAMLDDLKPACEAGS